MLLSCGCRRVTPVLMRDTSAPWCPCLGHVASSELCRVCCSLRFKMKTTNASTEEQVAAARASTDAAYAALMGARCAIRAARGVKAILRLKDWIHAQDPGLSSVCVVQ